MFTYSYLICNGFTGHFVPRLKKQKFLQRKLWSKCGITDKCTKQNLRSLLKPIIWIWSSKTDFVSSWLDNCRVKSSAGRTRKASVYDHISFLTAPRLSDALNISGQSSSNLTPLWSLLLAPAGGDLLSILGYIEIDKLEKNDIYVSVAFTFGTKWKMIENI